jgi:glycerol-3-phosphate acyltransferase PlsY
MTSHFPQTRPAGPAAAPPGHRPRPQAPLDAAARAQLSLFLSPAKPRGILWGVRAHRVVPQRHRGRPAALTLVGDLAKGLMPVLLARAWLTSPWAIGLVALAAVVGHLYPLYAGFRGGKGVATTLGAFIPLLPGPLLIAFVVWAVCVAWRRQVSLGSLAAAAALPLAALLWRAPGAYVLSALMAAALIWYRHGENIQRLRAGTEPTIGQGVKLP